MRHFIDEQGGSWVASVAQEEGGDYKGRFFLVMERAGDREGTEDGGSAESSAGVGEVVPARLPLQDVRWNSVKTAERTLATASDVELRRRLRAARGRAGRPVAPTMPGGGAGPRPLP